MVMFKTYNALTAQHSTAQHSTAQHSTAQLRANYVDLTTEYKNIQAYSAG